MSHYIEKDVLENIRKAAVDALLENGKDSAQSRKALNKIFTGGVLDEKAGGMLPYMGNVSPAVSGGAVCEITEAGKVCESALETMTLPLGSAGLRVSFL